jgi:hypothetical protein
MTPDKRVPRPGQGGKAHEVPAPVSLLQQQGGARHA